MIIIWSMILIVTTLTLVSEFYGTSKLLIDQNGLTVKINKPNKILFSFVVILLTLISGLRSSIGDTGYYMYSYTIKNDFNTIFSNKDWGYTLIQFILQKLSTHPQFVLIFTSIVSISLIMVTLYKYARPLTFAIFLFIAGGTYIATMNGLRQYMVAAVIFAATSFIIKNMKWNFIILVLLMSTIHSSVLIMIPIYFIVRQDAWSKNILFLVFLVLIFLFGFERFFGMFSIMLDSTQYGGYADTLDSYKGASILRIAVSAVPVVLGFIYRKKLAENVTSYNIIMNFSLLNFLTLLIASYSWIFARIGIYFGLYNLILIPAIIYYCFDKKLRVLVGFMAIVCYIVFFYFDSLSNIYSSYFLYINKELIGPLSKSMYIN
ncbi:EpsG family protein [Paenisporosarcina sp. TG-14]|uniref:EpsG family protein n=1 Tax=Paenisporosarcina sp. TG-14 TaxID=1231057 RepID=UPI0003053A59|nr:EpsG family protein [Paenisporosarcina sp. TG-14]